MKKTAFSLILSLAAANLMAQQEHLSFKGIPIAGSMTEFCQKLKAKGFASIGKSNTTSFSGDFTGRNATVAVLATDDDGANVFSMVVHFDPSREWRTLVKTYDYYKDLYIRKYGEPANSEEENPYLSYPDASNGILMGAVCHGRAVWSSVWEVASGDIQLSIEKYRNHEGRVMIRYRDSQSAETKIKNDLEEI